MPSQGHAHVVHLHGNGIAAEQALVQQFDPGALDEAKFQQTTLQFDLVTPMVAMGADLNDDAAVAASGLAQLDCICQFYARMNEASQPRIV